MPKLQTFGKEAAHGAPLPMRIFYLTNLTAFVVKGAKHIFCTITQP